MAGTVRKRTRTDGKGETKTTWLADYFDQHGTRQGEGLTFDFTDQGIGAASSSATPMKLAMAVAASSPRTIAGGPNA